MTTIVTILLMQALLVHSDGDLVLILSKSLINGFAYSYENALAADETILLAQRMLAERCSLLMGLSIRQKAAALGGYSCYRCGASWGGASDVVL